MAKAAAPTREGKVVNVLEGIKVVDITAWAFVPAAGGVLAHWGADVIKVERPGVGDDTRSWGPPFDDRGESAGP